MSKLYGRITCYVLLAPSPCQLLYLPLCQDLEGALSSREASPEYHAGLEAGLDHDEAMELQITAWEGGRSHNKEISKDRPSSTAGEERSESDEAYATMHERQRDTTPLMLQSAWEEALQAT